MTSFAADVAPNTRHCAPRIDGEREVRCILKGAGGTGVIASGKCLETQEEERCFCPAAFGAIRGGEELAARDVNGLDREAVELQQKQRARLVSLQTRARRFADAKQEYSGPALVLINTELERRARERAAAQRLPPARARAEAPVRETLIHRSPAPAATLPGPKGEIASEEKPPQTEPKGNNPDRLAEIEQSLEVRKCIGAAGKPCPNETTLRTNSTGDRCYLCQRDQVSADVRPCPKCKRPSSKLTTSRVCGRCAYAATQEKKAAPISAQAATEVSSPDTIVSKDPPRLGTGALIPEVLPKPARKLPHWQVQRDLISALKNLGFKLKTAEPAAAQAMRTIGPAPIEELLAEAMRLLREGIDPIIGVALAEPDREVRVCSWPNGCKTKIRADNESGMCEPHRRVDRPRGTSLVTCPKCQRKRYVLLESGICGTCESALAQKLPDRICAHPEGCTEKLARQNRSGLCARHQNNVRAHRWYAKFQELRDGELGVLPDPAKLPHDYLVECVEEAMRRREAFTKALFPSLRTDAPGEDFGEGQVPAQSVVPANVTKATA